MAFEEQPEPASSLSEQMEMAAVALRQLEALITLVEAFPELSPLLPQLREACAEARRVQGVGTAGPN